MSKHDLIQAIGEEVRRYHASVDMLDEAVARSLGINRTDLRCLDIVMREGRLAAGALATLSGLTTGAVTTVVDRLERRGLVRRTRDEADRRSVLLAPTAQAGRMAAEIYGPLAASGERSLRRFTADQLAACLEITRSSRAITDERVEQLRARGR
jgi:DNA-binding MarR family transcriptional regulator